MGTLPVWPGHVFISPTGNDATGNGSFDKPYATLPKAFSHMAPFVTDTLWIRGGTYKVTEEQVMATKEKVYAAVFDLNKNGTKTRPLCIMAYPGDERPVFDFSLVKPAGKRVSAFYMDGNHLHLKGFDIVGVQVTITTHTQSEGVSFRQNVGHNIVEDIRIHDGMGIGVYMTKGHDNLILNCDAYNNYDTVSENGRGGNSDGFGCHVAASNTGNVFRGCRAWRNSDDGFDLINCYAPVTFDHCWAWENGYDASLKNRADGNGFKAGGYGKQVQKADFEAPRHTISHCLAWANKSNGFYANHHLGGCNWINNTAYANGRYNYNLVNQQSWDNATDVPGYNHTVRNCLSFQARRGEYTNIDKSRCTLENNSFLPTLVRVTTDDFESLDASLLYAERLPDGSLPDIGFLKVKPGTAPYASSLGYQFSTTSTGIPIPRATPVSDGPEADWYTLQGVRVSRPTHGIYIHQGRITVRR